jgi:hypothetical protein
LLNNSQGQYRNAFKGLRLVLELILQGAYLSVYPVLLSEWLRSQADTSWQAILDPDNGVLVAASTSLIFGAIMKSCFDIFRGGLEAARAAAQAEPKSVA